MSLHQHPVPVSAPNLRIWDNAAFDAAAAADGIPLRQISFNQCEPLLGLAPSKENRRPPEPKNSPFLKHGPPKATVQAEGDDAAAIDAEIDAVEREIVCLSSRLEELRVKKAERDAGRRGRVVPAKFMAPPKNPVTTRVANKIPESPASGGRLQRRRAVSLGPAEIAGAAGIGRTPHRDSCFKKLGDVEEEAPAEAKISTTTPKSRLSIVKSSKKVTESLADASKVALRRRGISLGPLEIAAASNTSTGVRSANKNQLTKEQVAKRKKEKARSLSSSPKSRRQPPLSKVSDLRKGVATVGAKKLAKREEGMPLSIKPKVLFQEDGNGAQGKRPSKNAKVRIVPSRYSLVPPRLNADEPGSKRRKWSLPEPRKVASVNAGKRSLSLGESSKNLEPEVQLKGELETCCLLSSEESPPSIMKIAAMLPKIRTLRCMQESPRDSGCAKRVAELVGWKPHFGTAEGKEGNAPASPCKSLTFEGVDL